MTNSMTIQPDGRKVIVGVDTHKHVHVAVAIDTRGIRLSDQSFVADSGGDRALLTWAFRRPYTECRVVGAENAGHLLGISSLIELGCVYEADAEGLHRRL